MPKDTESLGNNKAPACESRGFVRKKGGAHFDTPPFLLDTTKQSLKLRRLYIWKHTAQVIKYTQH